MYVVLAYFYCSNFVTADEMKLKAAQEVSENLEVSFIPNNAHQFEPPSPIPNLPDHCELTALSKLPRDSHTDIPTAAEGW